jgi:DNA-binding GntR family transcriptional regulator
MDYSKPLAAQAYDYIKEKVLSGELEPDTFYSETKISKELKISRTPFREALLSLVQDGYIEIIPSRGFKIKTLNRKELLHSIEERCAIEGLCVYTLAEEIQTDKAQQVLRQLGERLTAMKDIMNGSKDMEEFINQDHEFHNSIIRYLDNDSFHSSFQRLHYLIQQTSEHALEIEGRIDATLDEHDRIYRTIAEGRKQDAYEEMIEHLRKPLSLLLKD